MELVSRERKHIYVIACNIDGDMAHSLNGISVKDYSLVTAYLTDFTDRLNRSDLVVGIHYCNQGCILADGILHLHGVD